MKKICILLFVFFIFTSMAIAFGSAFCEGWHDGYVAGYCYQKFACIPPIVPICPIPRIGEYTYIHGYNRGFLAGLGIRR